MGSLNIHIFVDRRFHVVKFFIYCSLYSRLFWLFIVLDLFWFGGLVFVFVRLIFASVETLLLGLRFIWGYHIVSNKVFFLEILDRCKNIFQDTYIWEIFCIIYFIRVIMNCYWFGRFLCHIVIVIEFCFFGYSCIFIWVILVWYSLVIRKVVCFIIVVIHYFFRVGFFIVW